MHDLIHLKYGSKLQVIYYNDVIRPLLKKASCVLTVSEYSRDEILNWTGFSPEKVIAVYNAVSGGYTRKGENSIPDISICYMLVIKDVTRI